MLGLVLAGGASRRYGYPKALARLGGETLLSRAYKTVLGAAGEACIALSSQAPGGVVEHARRLAGCVLWDDEGLPCTGPLRAVATALRRAPAVVYVSVDAPYVASGVLEALAALDPSAPSATLLRRGGVLAHHAGYVSRDALPHILRACRLKGRRARLSDAYRVPGAALAGWTLLASDPRVVVNINTPGPIGRREPPCRRQAKTPSDTPYTEALHRLELGDALEAARYFALEYQAHAAAGLATLAAHAARDAGLTVEAGIWSTRTKQ